MTYCTSEQILENIGGVIKKEACACAARTGRNNNHRDDPQKPEDPIIYNLQIEKHHAKIHAKYNANA